MPAYYTPPKTPTSSSPSPHPSSSARSSTYSQPTSTARNLTGDRRKTSFEPRDGQGKKHSRGIPYLFLGSIVAATLLADKYWPKGYPHGEKEDWELSKWALQVKARRRAEKAQAARQGGGGIGKDDHRRGGGSREEVLSHSSSAYDGCDECPSGADGSHHHREGRRARHYPGPEGHKLYSDHDGRRGREEPGLSQHVSESVFVRDRSRSRDRSRGRGRDRALEAGSSSSSHRRANSASRERTEKLLLIVNEQQHHDTPARNRYVLERAASTTTASPTTSGVPFLLERSSSSAPQRGYYLNVDRPTEVVYVYRDAPPGARRASFDVGEVRWYEDDYDSYYRI